MRLLRQFRSEYILSYCDSIHVDTNNIWSNLAICILVFILSGTLILTDLVFVYLCASIDSIKKYNLFIYSVVFIIQLSWIIMRAAETRYTQKRSRTSCEPAYQILPDCCEWFWLMPFKLRELNYSTRHLAISSVYYIGTPKKAVHICRFEG